MADYKTRHTVEHLLDSLSDSSKIRREAAEQELRSMGAAAVDALGDIVDSESDNKAWKRARIGNVATVTLAGFLVSLIYPFCPHKVQDEMLGMLLVLCSPIGVLSGISMMHEAPAWKPFGAITILGTVGIVVAMLTTLNTGVTQLFFAVAPPVLGGLLYYLALAGRVRLRPQIIDQAAEFTVTVSDRQVIPLLIQLDALASPARKRDVRAALATLLPTLEPTDAGILQASHFQHLHKALVSGGTKDIGFRVAILKALSQVGAVSSAQLVERLALSRLNSPIRDAARECLPLLQSRIAAQGDGLLRASARETPQQELMRAASASQIPETNTLLRASVSRQQDSTP